MGWLFPEQPRWITDDRGPGRNGLNDYGARAHTNSASDGDFAQNHRCCSKIDVIPYDRSASPRVSGPYRYVLSHGYAIT